VTADIGSLSSDAGTEVPTNDYLGPRGASAGTAVRNKVALTVIGAACCVGLLAAIPFVATSFATSTLTQVLAFAVLSLSLHVLMGWTGMVSLGQASYFGVAGYAVGLAAVRLTTNALALLVIGALAGGLIAAATGWLIVRSAGGYLLMLTLAIGELLATGANSWESLTGGYNGLAAIPSFTVGGKALDSPAWNYWFVLSVFLLIYALLAVIASSPFARALRGIRDNEPRMRSLGYATRIYKFGIFCIAGAVAGVAGTAWVSQARFISPSDLGYVNSAFVLVAVAVGGTTRQWGPCLGAGLIITAQQMLPRALEGKGPLVLGIVLIAVVYGLPGGVSAAPARVRAMIGRGR
jgi:branched-chain amino acid transport system permease protein